MSTKATSIEKLSGSPVQVSITSEHLLAGIQTLMHMVAAKSEKNCRGFVVSLSMCIQIGVSEIQRLSVLYDAAEHDELHSNG